MLGGDERRTGESYLYRYLAYRGKAQADGAMLALVQDKPDSELRAMVRRDSVRTPGSTPVDLWFDAGEFAAARQAYIDSLMEIGVPLLPSAGEDAKA